jgi:hypothetical protein
MEVTPKALAALAHSGKSPVAGPLAPCEDLRIYTYSIIAHADSELGIAKADLARMLVLRTACTKRTFRYSVAKRLPAARSNSSLTT